MSVPPPPRPGTIRPAGIGASYALNTTPQGRQPASIPVHRGGHDRGDHPRPDARPVLAQRHPAHHRARRRPRWAGLTAFWLGLAAIAFLFIGGGHRRSDTLRAIALPLSAVAGFFALIAIIAGVGRVLGWFGLHLRA